MFKSAAFSIIFVQVLVCIVNAQDNNVTYRDGEYLFQTVYDDSTITTKLTITKNKKVILDTVYDYDRLLSINGYDLEDDGEKEYLFDFYTGGAHCCTIMFIGKIKNDKFKFTDSLFWGNTGYEVKDLDEDGEPEIVGYNDVFAYAFTNYAQSFFSIIIYKYKNGKLHEVNKEHEKTVKKHIKELKDALSEYTVKGFDCPLSSDDDTFNTDAGAVKAILAPLTADYASIGRAANGYKLINEVYKCPDKDKFVKILKNEYELK